MNQKLRERREKTWDLLVVKGLQQKKVCERLSSQYDVKYNTIEKDITRMDEWLPKLERASSRNAYSRLKELRENRQRKHQMALQAQQDDDLKTELRIRDSITDDIEHDISLSQSVGLVETEPQKFEVDAEHSVRDLPDETEQLFAQWAGQTTETEEADE